MRQRLNRFILVIGLLYGLNNVSWACDCAIDYASHPITRADIEQATRFENSLVFAGTVVDIQPSPNPKRFRPVSDVTFRVSRWWKGSSEREIIVGNPDYACGYGFKVGHEYLVYTDGGRVTSYCTPTKPLSEAKADIAILGSGYLPVNLTANSRPYLLVIWGMILATGVTYWRRKRIQ